MENEKITIGKEEYLDLMRAQNLLLALESVGLKDWEGYQDALDLVATLEQEEREEPWESIVI